MSHKYKARRFEGKVALISASTEGIGLATADRLAHEGACVVISSRHASNVERALQELRDSGIPEERLAGTVCHVGKAEDRQHLVDFALKRFGKIDVLFNNAGINPAVGHILDVTPSLYKKIYDVNVKATFLLSRMVAEKMKRTGGGVIIFNATFGAYQPLKGVRAYGLLKTALLGVTQSLAHELARFNIRVNTVCPGLIKTRMGSVMFDKNNPRNKLVGTECIWAMERLGLPEEMAAVVAYLASDDASFVTGESLLATGGAECRL